MAKAFTFQAETLLRARRQHLTAARQELAAAQAACDAAVRQAASAESTVRELDAAARSAIEAGTSGGKLEAYRRSVRGARELLGRRREELAAAQARRERCRREVAERLKQSRVLESVREQKLAAHERVSRRSETDQRDDEHAARAAAGKR